MPINKKRLSAIEQLRYRRCLAQLRAEGLDLDDDLEMLTPTENTCPLEIAASHCGFVYDSQAICADAVLPLSIRAYETVTFEECDIEVVSDEVMFNMLDLRPDRGCYCLGSRSFAAEEVLNDCFGSVYTRKPFRLRRGHTCEGVVLGYIDKSRPEHLETGILAVRVTVVDSLCRRVEAEIPLAVRRVNQRLAAAPDKALQESNRLHRPQGNGFGVRLGGSCRRKREANVTPFVFEI